MNYLPDIATVALVQALVLISPGPDFILVTRNSLLYSKRSGIYTAFGVSLGILVHVAYCLAGLALLISRSDLIFSIIKLCGGGYLAWIGYKSLRAPRPAQSSGGAITESHLGTAASIRRGFLTNVMNPKVTLLFLGLFTLVIRPATPFLVRLIMGAEMSLATFLWYALVAALFSQQALKKRLQRILYYIEKVTGGLLLLLGIKLVFSAK